MFTDAEIEQLAQAENEPNFHDLSLFLVLDAEFDQLVW